MGTGPVHDRAMSLIRPPDALETDRLVLRHRRVDEADIFRRLWTERDERARTTVLPVVSPRIIARNASTAWSRPSTTVSSYAICPAANHSAHVREERGVVLQVVRDGEPAQRQPLLDDPGQVPRPGLRVLVVVPGDRPAQRRPARRVAACRSPPRGARRRRCRSTRRSRPARPRAAAGTGDRPCSRRPRRTRTAPAPAPPSRPTRREPTTRDAPLSLAICPTIDPTAPAAPDTNTTSPGCIGAICSSPRCAVNPVRPSTPRYADSGTPSSTTRNCAASPCATSRHPRSCVTAAPTGTSADVDSTTRPTAPPVIVASSANGATYDSASFIRPRMYGSTERNSLATRTWSGSRSGRSTVTVRKSSGTGHPCGRRTSWTWVLVVVIPRCWCRSVDRAARRVRDARAAEERRRGAGRATRGRCAPARPAAR